MNVRALGPGDEEAVVAAQHLFDGPSDAAATARFLADSNHHLLVAYDPDDRPVGFVSGVEMTHPDKGTEIFLYELAVAEAAQRRGVGAREYQTVATAVSGAVRFRNESKGLTIRCSRFFRLISSPAHSRRWDGEPSRAVKRPGSAFCLFGPRPVDQRPTAVSARASSRSRVFPQNAREGWAPSSFRLEHERRVPGSSP